MNILVVEDHPEVLDCLRSYFSEMGHDVSSAGTTEEALRHLGQREYDMAFVDLILPRGHGREVIQEIAARASRAREAEGGMFVPTRVIVVTGCSDLGLRRDLMALGVSDYLYKPVTVRDLDRLLHPAGKGERTEDRG